MGFSIPDMWVWDAWYIRNGDTTHMYFLKAPKSVGNPDHRHFYATIGHASSKDLINWTYHGTALEPSKGPAWDDLATWTGCVVKRPQGGWILYYTGTSRAERGHVQRIGAATSDDLFNWEKVGSSPLLEADAQFYGKLGDTGCGDEACRDPFVFQVEGDARWHMVYTANGKWNKITENGVIGYAVSDDMLSWQAGAPQVDLRIAQELEVPEIFRLGAHWYLAYSTWGWGASETHEAAIGHKVLSGTHYLRSRSGPLGPWEMIDTGGLLTDADEKIYVARKVDMPDGRTALIAFNNRNDDGEFPGTLTSPIEFHATATGRLELTRPDLKTRSA